MEGITIAFCCFLSYSYLPLFSSFAALICILLIFCMTCFDSFLIFHSYIFLIVCGYYRTYEKLLKNYKNLFQADNELITVVLKSSFSFSITLCYECHKKYLHIFCIHYSSLIIIVIFYALVF